MSPDTVKKYFLPAKNLIRAETILSPTGKYSLTIEVYSTGPETWKYSKGTIKEGENVIKEVYRNYEDFWYAWVENHPSGNAYILYGEDYQGYTVYNLTNRTAKVYLPDAAAGGRGWCFIEAVPNPSCDKLAVLGCFWGDPEELAFFDITDLETLPLKEIRKDYCLMSSGDMVWESDTRIVVKKNTDFCTYYNKSLDDMTDEEMDYIDFMENEILKEVPDYAEDYFYQYDKVTLDVFDTEYCKTEIIENKNITIDNIIKNL